MQKLIRDWTEGHTWVLLVGVLMLGSGALVAAHSGTARLLMILVACACVLIGLGSDVYAGLLAGFLGGGAMTWLLRQQSEWEPTLAALAYSTVLVLLVLGWAGGMTGAMLRQPPPATERRAADDALGLLPATLVQDRLTEELARLEHGGRHVSLLLVELRRRPEVTLDEQSEQTARRSLARLVESRLREIDVPFTLDDTRLGALLPDVDEAESWALCADLLSGAAEATFAHRAEGTRLPLVDAAEVLATVVTADPAQQDAEGLLARAEGSLAA